MSARTPFNPTRPAAAGTTGDTTANANQQFQPDPSNPLHTDPPAPVNQAPKTKNSRASLGNGATAPMPLNVASLKPKKRPNTPNSGKPTAHPASRTGDQPQARPATADPSAQQHKTLTNHRLANRESAHQSNALNLAVSSPRTAPPNTPGPILQSNANANVFKHPGLPASAAHDLFPEDAHTPSSMTPLQRFSGYNNGQPMEDDPFFTSRVEEYERRRSRGSAMESPPMGDQSLLRHGPIRGKRNRIEADDIPAQAEYPANPKRYKGNQMSVDGYDMPEVLPLLQLHRKTDSLRRIMTALSTTCPAPARTTLSIRKALRTAAPRYATARAAAPAARRARTPSSSHRPRTLSRHPSRHRRSPSASTACWGPIRTRMWRRIWRRMRSWSSAGRTVRWRSGRRGRWVSWLGSRGRLVCVLIVSLAELTKKYGRLLEVVSAPVSPRAQQCYSRTFMQAQKHMTCVSILVGSLVHY